MNLDEHTCPWGFEIPDLSEVRLTVIEKKWLGRQIVNGLISTSELSHRYQIPRRTLRNYSNKVRKGLPMFFGGGRPRALDTESCENCSNFIDQTPNCQRQELKPIIRAQHKETLVRRYPNKNANDLPEKNLSKRSIVRYSDRLLLIHHI